VPRPRIFISYAHADKPLARTLVEGLRACDIEAWIDEQELRAGDSIVERVANAVASTDFFLALVSPASVKSRWCQKELHLAIAEQLGGVGVRVLPLRVGDVEMPATLADVFYLDLDPADISPTVQRLVDDVGRHVREQGQRIGQELRAPPANPTDQLVLRPSQPTVAPRPIDSSHVVEAASAGLRRVRRERGIALDQLSDACGIHPTYLAAVERGERNPSLHNLGRIAAGLGVPGWQLLLPEKAVPT